jgi:hypothetical protein
MTLGEWAERWLRESEGRLRPRTVLTYSQALAPVIGLLGYRRLDSLEPVHVHQALEELRERGRGARSLEQAHVYLHGCLERARNWASWATTP